MMIFAVRLIRIRLSLLLIEFLLPRLPFENSIPMIALVRARILE